MLSISAQEGKNHGYLAFDGNTSIGWCNAGDLSAYINVGFDEDVSEFIHRNACAKTMSVSLLCHCTDTAAEESQQPCLNELYKMLPLAASM